jgi:hypothetical protein
MLRGIAGVNRRFGGQWALLPPCSQYKIKPTKQLAKNRVSFMLDYWSLFACLSITLKTEAVGSFQTSVNLCQISRCEVTEVIFTVIVIKTKNQIYILFYVLINY